MTDLEGLHARAAETLDITEPWVRRAFEAVPRHEFVTGTVWVVDGGVYRPLRREDDPDRWARMVYDPAQAIATQVDDGTPAPVGGDVPTSSISAPAAVVTMLAELDLRPGHRVLEIGAGTGYNAALLAERAGAERVTTLDIDPDVADGARGALHRAGYGGVTVLEADGEQGWRGGAPYDRADLDVAALADPHAEFAVGLKFADVAHWPQDGGHWWCSRDSWAYAADGAVHQWGPRDLADETAEALTWW